MQPCSREMESSINSILNQFDLQQNAADHHNHHHQQQFDPTHDEFLDQMLHPLPSSWPIDLSSAAAAAKPQGLWDQSTLLDSKLRQHQIGSAKALMFQQQLILSQGLAPDSGNELRSPTGASNNLGFLHNDVCLDDSPFHSANSANAAAVQALYDGSLGQPSIQSQHFHQGGGVHAQNIAVTSGINSQPVVSRSTSGGAAAAQPKQQKVRARRGQATDPHSIAERLRRERIAERMKALQELVPNANKTDKASMLDEIVDYVKFLQLQVKVLSMSRLGGAAAVAPLVADMSSEVGGGGVGESVHGNGKSSNGTKAVSSSNDSMTVTEQQVAKMMEEDMGFAMQYLQGKGLCLMPISLANAISTTTSHSMNPNVRQNLNGNRSNNPRLVPGENGVGDAGGGPTSPNLSVLTG